MKNYLNTRQSNKTGLSLDCVTRVNIRGPYNGPIDSPEDPPTHDHQDRPYVLIDEELIACAPILRHSTTHEQLAASDKILKTTGPFENGFLADLVEIFDILHTVWCKSSWWTHCKAFTKTKRMAIRRS